MPVSLAVLASEKSGRAAKKRASLHFSPVPSTQFSWNSCRSVLPTVLEPSTVLISTYKLKISILLSFSLPLQSIQKTLNTSAPSTTFISIVLIITGKRPRKAARKETMMAWSPCKPRGNGRILKTLQPTLHQSFHQSNRQPLQKNDGSLAYGTFRKNGAGLVIQKPV